MPGSFVAKDASAEQECLHAASASIVRAIHELSDRLKLNIKDADVRLAVGKQVYEQRWDNRLHRYFHIHWVSGRNIFDVLPRIDPDADMWRPYEWIPRQRLREKILSPLDAAACEHAFL